MYTYIHIIKRMMNNLNAYTLYVNMYARLHLHI